MERREKQHFWLERQNEQPVVSFLGGGVASVRSQYKCLYYPLTPSKHPHIHYFTRPLTQTLIKRRGDQLGGASARGQSAVRRPGFGLPTLALCSWSWLLPTTCWRGCEEETGFSKADDAASSLGRRWGRNWARLRRPGMPAGVGHILQAPKLNFLTQRAKDNS